MIAVPRRAEDQGPDHAAPSAAARDRAHEVDRPTGPEAARVRARREVRSPARAAPRSRRGSNSFTMTERLSR